MTTTTKAKRTTKKGIRTAITLDQQPVSTVVWIKRDQLLANNYNPNHVAPPEMRLLKLSILEDGWTQPIVARPISSNTDGSDVGMASMTYEIVDGFHRWTVSGDPEVLAMTGGLVPVVILNAADEAHQQMSTIRHNRARGQHYVVKMADIVHDLIVNRGCTIPDVMERLQMEEEEVERLLDRGDKLKRGAADGFNKAWTTK
jgi:ParB-like chromosome segregation protein Spo0J